MCFSDANAPAWSLSEEDLSAVYHDGTRLTYTEGGQAYNLVSDHIKCPAQ